MKTYDARLLSADTMTTAQVAEALHVHPRTIYRYMDSGLLNPQKIEGRLLFSTSEVMKLTAPGGSSQRIPHTSLDAQAQSIARYLAQQGIVKPDAQVVLDWLQSLQAAQS